MEFSNPNKRQNRVPTEAEVATLRKIRAEKRELGKNIATLLSSAIESHGQIQTRYNNLLREIEGVQSELTITFNYISTLKRQQEILQAEDEDLAGLLHPIRRLPEDILKIVFEYAATASSTPFETSTSISHVCGFWRAVALSMSSLWAGISISANDNIKEVCLYLERTRERLRAAPVYITIWEIGECPVEHLKIFMEKIELHKFKTISTLNYRIGTIKGLVHLADPIQPIQPISSASVAAVIITAEFQSEKTLKWDFTCIIKQLPSLVALCLRVDATITISGTKSYPILKTLDIVPGSAPSLALQLHRFPELEELAVLGHPFDFEPLLQDITMPKLRCLKIFQAQRFPWNKLSTPCLQELRTEDWSSLTVDFLCRHTSVSKLAYYSGEGSEAEFGRLARSLVNLECLSIYGGVKGLYTEIDSDLISLPFPKLEDLLIEDTEDNPLTLSDFENVLRRRFLAQETGSMKPLSRLQIAIDYNEVESRPWRKSTLLGCFHEVIEPSLETITLTLK